MSIVLNQLQKRYGDLVVVDNISLDVADGELFVLLGTSGSGKSTILRLIAGLSQADGGTITLHGRDVTDVSPQQRGTGFVFQNYSIFRHMSVAQNIEFGLKIHKVPKAERAERRDRLLDLVGMAGYGNRYSDQLSGGQQQRVALARSLAYEPNVLLLDEPFGALDVKTRSQLRRSLKEVQRELGVTAILVTHDQDEAFELADRIGILDRGKLLEVGRPESLYTKPQTLFGATFLGAGTVLVGRINNDEAHFGHLRLPIPEDVPHEDGASVQLLFRPEQVLLSSEEPINGPVIGRGKVIEQNFSGALRRVRLRLPHLPAARQISPVVSFGEEGIIVDAILPSGTTLTDQELWVSLQRWSILKQPESRLLIFDSVKYSSSPLRQASRMVEQMNASTTLVSVTDDGDKVETVRSELQERGRQARLMSAELHVRVGEAAEQILTEQHEGLYTLVMLAPQIGKYDSNGDDRLRQKGLRRWLRRTNRLGETVIKILERASIPVMIVKKEKPRIERILICVAISEAGKTDVRVGGRLARQLNAAVTLLYVTKETEPVSEFIRGYLERGVATLRGLDVSVELRMIQARTPAKGILAESRKGHFDLIVVGRHRSDPRFLLGENDVTLQVLVGADCPVLVVPMEDF